MAVKCAEEEVCAVAGPGRPRVYDENWTRRGQRWPVELLQEIDVVARRLGTNREQLVVGIVEDWMLDYERTQPQGSLL